MDQKLIHQICGLVDPFCPHARGAKYPDDSAAKTLPFTVQFNQTMTTSAGGVAGVLCLPAWDYNPLITSSVSGTTMSNTGPVAAPVAPLTGYKQARIVSMGLRLTNVSPLLERQGMVYLRAWQDENGSSMNSVDGASYGATFAKNIALSDLTEELIVIPHSSQMPQRLYDAAWAATPAGTADWSAVGFTPFTILVSGGPASAASVHIEVIMHLEYTFADGYSLGLAATPPPPPNPLVTTAANRITSVGEKIATSVTDGLGNWVVAKATEFIVGAITRSPSAGRLAGASYQAIAVD